MAVAQGTDAWLAARREGLGSSDAPIVAGEKGSIVELWAQKCGLVEVEEPDADLANLFAMGHLLEPVIARAYTERTGRPLRRVTRLLRHPQVPWALASLDRVSARKGERRIVEIKNTRSPRWTAGAEAVPGDVQAQVQHQLWVTGYDVADVAVLVAGSDLRILEVPRDDAFIANLAWLEEEFWRHVTSRTRPSVDGSVATRCVLARLHPADDGVLLAPTPEITGLAIELREAKEAAKAAADRLGSIENAFRALIGDAAGFAGDGWRVTWKRTADSSRTDWQALAADVEDEFERSEATALLRWFEDRQAARTETKPGSRRLLATFGDGGTT